MKKQAEIKISGNIEELTEEFVKLLQDQLHRKNDNEPVTFALSGGSTPKSLFREIGNHHKNQIDWSRIKFFWSDERCVPPNTEESNYKMACNNLLKKLPVPEKNIFRIHGENNPEEEAERYSKVARKHVGYSGNHLQFDIIMLGLGVDGHTASVFPGNEILFHSHSLFTSTKHPETGQKRITMTGKVINHASNVVFLVSGKSKAQILSEVLEPSFQTHPYPASLVRPENGKLTWLVDTEAAKYLKRNQ